MAAGKGTRMNSPDMAKVMFPVGGVPMVHHVVDRALEQRPERVIVIIGHNRESVRSYLTGRFGDRVQFAEQVEQLGTGHAVMQAAPLLEGFTGDVLVLTAASLCERVTSVALYEPTHRERAAVATVLTVTADDPTGYGRVVRGAGGTVTRIVEQAVQRNEDAAATFARICEAAYKMRGDVDFIHPPPLVEPLRLRPPRLTEAWFC